jgi:hypothetical protein
MLADRHKNHFNPYSSNDFLSELLLGSARIIGVTVETRNSKTRLTTNPFEDKMVFLRI